MSRKLYRRVPSGTSIASRLKLSEEPIPALPSDTSLLIRVRAVSLNYRDANILNGTNPWPVKADGVPCSDAAGDVVTVGPKVTKFRVGDRVIPMVNQKAITGREQEREWLGGEVDGTLATHVVFEEATVVRAPDHLSYAEAACLPNAGLTAWSALANRGTLSPGMTVLSQGTGGVSIMAVKLAIAAGCKVILTSSSDSKLEQVKSHVQSGSLLTINYATTPDWDAEAVKLNGGSGVDVVVENGGTSSLIRSIKAAKTGGVVSQVGYLGKQRATDLEGLLSLLIEKTVSLRGINIGSVPDFEDMNRLIAASGLRLDAVIDHRFDFEQTAEAIQYLWSGKHVGKIVIEF